MRFQVNGPFGHVTATDNEAAARIEAMHVSAATGRKATVYDRRCGMTVYEARSGCGRNLHPAIVRETSRML